MQQRWRNLATVRVVALVGALAALHAEAAAVGSSPASLPSPLTAQAFTEAVLSRNASLEAMRQAVAAAVLRIRPAGALEDPMLTVSTAPRSFGSPMGVGGDIEVSQSLPWRGTLDARAQVARAQAEATRQDLDGLKLRLAALARGAFSDWVFVHRALAINIANQSVLTELRSIARVRYMTGQAPQGDILQADFERTMLRQQRLELERDRAAALARMNALLERAPEAPMPQPAKLLSNAPLPAEEALAGRVLGNPQLARLAAEERAAEAQQRLAAKERYPRVALSAGYRVSTLLSGQQGVQSVFAERVAQGFYVDIAVNRPLAARYGLDVGDVQRAVESGIGGEDIAQTVEGRERYPISVRYNRDFRGDIPALSRVMIATPSGAQIPLGEVASISLSRGPSMVRDEEAQLTGDVFFNLTTADYGGFVARADRLLRQKLSLPPGYTYTWSGEYQLAQHAKASLRLVLPVVLIAIFMLLYLLIRSAAEAAMLFFPTCLALIGGLLL